MKRRTVLARNRNAYKSGIPPYTHYGKEPFEYSPRYREWFKAARKAHGSPLSGKLT
jgi:hypothetical protein